MEVTVSSTYDPSDLAASWKELETSAQGGFFLSWRWIGSWLQTTGANPLLVKAQEAGKIAAMGLVVRSGRRCLSLPVRQLCLHETGRA